MVQLHERPSARSAQRSRAADVVRDDFALQEGSKQCIFTIGLRNGRSKRARGSRAADVEREDVALQEQSGAASRLVTAVLERSRQGGHEKQILSEDATLQEGNGAASRKDFSAVVQSGHAD